MMKKTLRIAVSSVLLLTILAVGFTIARFARDVQGSCAENAAVAKGEYKSWTADRDKFESASDKDIEEIIRKAGTGDVLSLRNLGYRYMTGTGVPEDKDKAYEIYMKLADGGDAFGMMVLGNFHNWGLGGKPINYKKAFEWYDKAVENNSVQAAVFICGLYRRGGDAFPADQEKAAEYASLAENMANESGKTDDLMILAGSFESGGHLPRDYQKALFYYNAAASKGNVIAMLSLAATYYDGTFLDVDLREARRWMDAAYADRGESAINLLIRVAKPEKVEEIKKWYYEGKK